MLSFVALILLLPLPAMPIITSHQKAHKAHTYISSACCNWTHPLRFLSDATFSLKALVMPPPRSLYPRLYLSCGTSPLSFVSGMGQFCLIFSLSYCIRLLCCTTNHPKVQWLTTVIILLILLRASWALVCLGRLGPMGCLFQARNWE